MKIKELQIDDLILCDLSAFGAEPPYKDKCVVRKISRDVIECMPLDENGNDRYGYISEVYESEIEPIPLTAEILEKNGFEKICLKSGQVVYSFADDYYDLEAEEITDSIWRIEYFNVEASFPSCRDLVGFVHEIQHFLNSHIIEKEIEL